MCCFAILKQVSSMPELVVLLFTCKSYEICLFYSIIFNKYKPDFDYVQSFLLRNKFNDYDHIIQSYSGYNVLSAFHSPLCLRLCVAAQKRQTKVKKISDFPKARGKEDICFGLPNIL